MRSSDQIGFSDRLGVGRPCLWACDVSADKHMGYSKVVVILPGYGLDNLPYDIDDPQAEGLLNAFAAACHPQLLAACEQLPAWHSCDDHADGATGTLYIIPPVSEDHLYGGWLESGSEVSGVVRGISDRSELVSALLTEAGIEAADQLDEELAADCMAIGIAHALMELLTQQMHYFTNIDEEVLSQNAVAAAQAIVAGDHEQARQKLTVAFETLVEARERFYPVDCYLLDLCLLNVEQADAHLANVVAAGTPVNLLIEGRDLEQLQQSTQELIRNGLRAENPEQPARVALVGGEYADVAAPLVPLGDWLLDFERGLGVFSKHTGSLPVAWARKRFGFSPLLPQILRGFGYKVALHFALDDGTYPDTEHSKLSWEGCDGSQIDALTRIPVAMDSAAAFLKLPQRISESMQEDMVAAVLFARLPEMRSPWLSDFQRIHKYGQVFGRFVTLEEFAAESGDSGHHARYEAREYLSPFLIQGSALGQPRPASRFADAHLRRSRLDTALRVSALTDLIRGRHERADERGQLLRRVRHADEENPATEEILHAIDELAESAVADLAKLCGASTTEPAGVFVFNPVPASRPVLVEVPSTSGTLPVICQVPALGYAWVSADDFEPSELKTPLASRTLLHNGKFEVRINEESGSIACIKGFGRSPNRLSQQIAFRFERPQAAGTDEHGEAVLTSYSTMRCQQLEVTRCDDVVGEVRSVGELLDPSGARMASFVQTTRVMRGVPFVDIDIELNEIQHSPDGNPWLTYYGCRFAWDDAAAALTRSVFGQAHGFSGERFETPHYLEIASEERRTTILSHGMPFFRKTDLRMADAILVPEGESERRFRFTIAIDQPYPEVAALDVMTPPLTLPTAQPKAGRQGWFVAVSARNVLITGFPEPVDPVPGVYRVRLLETEGRSVTMQLACFRSPQAARKVDFHGNTTEQLVVESDGAVTIEIRKYELCDVEVDFRQP